MNSKIAAAVAIIGALGLAACDNVPGRRANSGLCTNFKASGATNSPLPPVTLNDGAAPVVECVRRWSYSLASAGDPADVVADAVVAACSAEVGRWNQASLSRPSNGEGLSLSTGQPSNPLVEHGAFVRGRALLYVVEARAGQCAPPDVINAVPAGTSPI